MPGFELVAYITEAPTIEIRSNVVHVKDRSGNTKIERTMSIKSFEKYLERGRRALDLYEGGQETVSVDD